MLLVHSNCLMLFIFFFNDTATTEIYTLSLHDALPIFDKDIRNELRAGSDPYFASHDAVGADLGELVDKGVAVEDRKSTRLNSSHANISYAVFCLKKKIR